MKSTKSISNMFHKPMKNQPYSVVVLPSHTRVTVLLLALPTTARIFIVFRFIIEYSSLRDFGLLGNNNRSILI